jgi:hypothetical protein
VSNQIHDLYSNNLQQVKNKLKHYGFFWITLGLFIMSISLHWIFSWYSYVQEQTEHNQPLKFNDYLNETMRDTMENWQSEFLQLMWQVVGLAMLWYIGSHQSKESIDRREEKIDSIIKELEPENGERLVQEIDKKYARVMEWVIEFYIPLF